MTRERVAPPPAPERHSKAMSIFFIKVGLEKERAKFRAGQEPAETQVKIVQRTIFVTRERVAPPPAPERHSKAMSIFFIKVGLEKERAKFRAGQEPAETQVKIVQRTIFVTRERVAPPPAPERHSKAMSIFFIKVGLEKERAKFRAGQEPAETQVKIVQRTIFVTRERVAPPPAPIKQACNVCNGQTYRNGNNRSKSSCIVLV